MNPNYPIYIVSKGRYNTRLTVKTMEKIRCPYKIVVEEHEYDLYCKYINRENIIKLPFSNLGQGSIPARNYIWQHSIENGHKRHWILDDNINGFVRLNNNIKIPVSSATIFRAAEDFVDRYQNIALAGFDYRFFSKQKQSLTPFRLNTRVYSCILIKNDIDYRWRGIYNEDTDLSIRVLKDGYCTVLFSAFLCNKAATLTMNGGNTDTLYKENGRLLMAQSLRDQHPDIVTITTKFGRYQHQVDYSKFQNNRLVINKSADQPINEINNYGMILRKKT